MAFFLGVGIGNGWISPRNQAHSWSEFGMAAGVVDEKLRDQIFYMEENVL